MRHLPEERLTNADIELVRFYKRETFCFVFGDGQEGKPITFFAGSLAASLLKFLTLQLREMYYVC